MNITSQFGLPSLTATLSLAAVLGCQNKIPPPEPENRAAPVASAVASVSREAPSPASHEASASGTAGSAPSAAVSAGAGTSATAASSDGVKAPASPESPRVDGDPLQGKFSLEDATKGLAKSGKLVAEIVTDAGTLKCELFEDKAPITVANFVGLARGIRPFKDPKTGIWGKRPGYDNGVFHRIIKGFMIQGGDPTGTGATDGGYVIPDEVWPGATHDRRGLICMANRGKNTNSMQFFITDAPAKHLDGGYTIFGSCGPDAVIEKLASAEVRGDRAVNPPKIKKVSIKRSK